MNKIQYILLTLCLLLISSCISFEEHKVVSGSAEGYVDLSLSIEVPFDALQTKSIQSDPKNQGDSWTTWEKYVDGALLYRVTIFIVNSEGTLVAYRNIYSGSSDIKAEDALEGGNGFYEDPAVNTSATAGVAVKATFKASNPLHGNIEKLTPGNYKVIAVANYAPITVDGNTYAGLGNESEDGEAETDIVNNNGVGGDFTSMVNSLIASTGDFAGVKNALADPLFAYQLNSGSDRVCKQLPQPLVMVRDIALNTGETQVNGLLSRTFARVRVEVKNNDILQYIGISSFSFKDNYASRRAWLFNDITDESSLLNDNYTNFNLYEDTKGTIGVSSADAIIPFTAVDESSMRRMPPGTTYSMFDCYILEGQISGDYAFDFLASYWSAGSGGDATPELHITKFYQAEYGDNYQSGNRDPYGLLEYNVFLRCEASVKNNAQSESESTTLMKAESDAFSSDGEVVIGTPTLTNGEIVLGTTYIDPDFIWQITLNTPESEISSNPLTYGSGVSSSSGNQWGGGDNNQGNGVGFEDGALQNLGTGLYLQAYDGGDDMTPKLSETPDETLIFKINLKDMYEVGTVFCLVNGTYYRLQYDGKTVKWVDAGTSVTEDSGEYRYFTWETIGGTGGTREDVLIEKEITSSGSLKTNVIARNDFYYGIIPLSISSESACLIVPAEKLNLAWNNVEGPQNITAYSDSNYTTPIGTFYASSGLYSTTLFLKILPSQTSTMVYFKFEYNSVSYTASATVQQLLDGVTLNFNAAS